MMLTEVVSVGIVAAIVGALAGALANHRLTISKQRRRAEEVRNQHFHTGGTDQPAYPLRVTTFIDILGFTRDVRRLNRNPQLILPIEAVLRHIANCKRDIDQARAQGRSRHDARMTAFSDCVVLSYSPEPDAAARALADAAFLGHVMLRAGFLPRGAITLGRLWHDDNSMFGEAFLDAYDLETKKANTPRILVTDAAIDLAHQFLGSHEGPETEPGCIRNDGDGRYLHILSKQWRFLHKEKAEELAGKYQGSGIRELFEELQAMLPLRYLEATERERIKHEWMRDYVNLALEEHQLPATLRVELPAVPNQGEFGQDDATTPATD